MHCKNAIVFRKWMGFQSERTSRSACLPKSLGFMEIRYSCKRNQISKRICQKSNCHSFVIAISVGKQVVKTISKWVRCVWPNLLWVFEARSPEELFMLQFPGLSLGLYLSPTFLHLGGLYMWAWIFTTLFSSQIHSYPYYPVTCRGLRCFSNEQ